MKARVFYLSLLMFWTLSTVNTFDPLTVALLVGAGSTLAPLAWVTWGHFNERCDSTWIHFNEPGLRSDLENKLVGQHIASPIIFKAVAGFMKNPHPRKPLVLFLQGPTGTGKNFVAQMIANNIYKKGNVSQFFHVFTYQLDFPHQSQIETYKSQLQQWIKGNVSRCAHSIFVFDEVDKLHPGLFDSIYPYLDHHNQLQGVSYKNAIFIFLSNAGASDITKIALDFWQSGRTREDIKLKDLEKVISQSAFNDKMGGLWHSPLIDRNLVNFYVPFLPLEYKHVLQCVFAEMKARNLSTNGDIAKQLADDLVFYPNPMRVFSAQGCKTIHARLDFYI
eukprot:XP_003965360.2 PREDICTED: torsin-1A-like [Takifugu rubripes]